MTDDALSLEEFQSLIGGRVESIEPITETGVKITAEYLDGLIANLEGQREQAKMTMHGAEGAIQACNAIKAQLEKPEPDNVPTEPE